MSRFIATAWLLIFGGDVVLPALPANSESSLPACCRRDGKHHCAMMEQESAGPSWKAAARKCPLFPKGTAAFFTAQSALPRAAYFAGPIASHPAAQAQTEIIYRVSHSRARQKRGPPCLA